ncbi:hypothetical protein RM844_28420 [Streptomyces sp. DSM 44915]|uniref:Uncharacterized protein n=1 Tax=Streptomyces chisholmiae TaxID=3075540 RepID=A0ABU2JZE4_9ACTN|nr:hypothetical protein [Streptomyces sp. DSM 44915]MDT0270202.1 hypothetical protein [Streptomyces sp. DSM 44915]
MFHQAPARRLRRALLGVAALASTVTLLAGPETASGAPSSAAPMVAAGYCGDPTTPAGIEGNQGIPTENQQKFQALVTKERQYLVDVRPTNVKSVPFLKNRTGLPKPQEVKAKTINALDVQLGAQAGITEADQGKVGYFKPVMPEGPSSDPLTKRFQQRDDEFSYLAGDMQRLVASGEFRVTHGVVERQDPAGGGFKPLVGDHDVFDIRNLQSQEVSMPEHDALIQEMRAGDMAVMHGAHMYWITKNAHEEEMKQQIIQAHSAPNGEKLVRFIPNAQPRLVFAAEPLWCA